MAASSKRKGSQELPSLACSLAPSTMRKDATVVIGYRIPSGMLGDPRGLSSLIYEDRIL